MRRFVLCIFFAASASVLGRAQTPDPTLPPAGQQAVLTVQGIGAQVYRCQTPPAGPAWGFTAPVARLFDTAGKEVGTHGDGPVWNYQDGSAIHGSLLTKNPSPDAANIPWLLLKATAPQRTGLLATVEYIRRSDTHGGLAPATGCDAAHQGDLARVPYTATYTFYSSKASGS